MLDNKHKEKLLGIPIYYYDNNNDEDTREFMISKQWDEW